MNKFFKKIKKIKTDLKKLTKIGNIYPDLSTGRTQISYISTYKEIRHQKSKINKKITIPINLTKYMKWKKSWKNTNYTKK